MTAKLCILARTQESLSAVARQLPPADSNTSVSHLSGGARELVSEIERNRPDLVVAEIPILSDLELRALSNALAASAPTGLILLTGERSPEYLLKLMRSGVREVVLTPVAGDELTLAYKRQIDRLAIARGPAKRAKVIAFVPAKGGSGATFLATNLAYALAQRKRRTALLDLNLHFGDAAIFVSEVRPLQTVSDLAREIGRVDATFLEATMLQIASNYWLLAAPDSPESAIDVSPEAIERIITVASGNYDFVVLDMGRILEAVGVRALDLADEIYIVVQPTLPFIHDAKRLTSLLGKLGFARDRLRLIVNRYEKGGDISITDIESALDLKLTLSVPNNFGPVAYSINRGMPILKHAPRDVVSKALNQLADSLAPKQRSGRGWFRAFGGGGD
ncbi:MAG: AAA family ATPase [Burkholderiaceae bacterium]|nr:AAA family ATPase [Burkholderiaceae bacterium]